MRSAAPVTKPGRGSDLQLDLEVPVDVLLDRSAAPFEQKLACETIYQACLKHLPALEVQAMQLPAGKAISPADAARCVLDFLRTARFLQAVDQALLARARHAPGRGIELLYAGCGPLAPLALLLAHRHRDNGLRITLVDAHAASLSNAGRLFELAGVSDLLHDCVCADATRLTLARGRAPDLLVAEVMQRALSREPQLEVVANLFPQCALDAVLIPRRVSVSAWLARMGSELQPDAAPERIELGSLLDLSSTTLPDLVECLRSDSDALPEQCLQLPEILPQGLSLMLRTGIETGPDLLLGDYDSGLTYPQFLWNFDELAPACALGFTYRMGSDPGFHVRRLRSADAGAPKVPTERECGQAQNVDASDSTQLL